MPQQPPSRSGSRNCTHLAQDERYKIHILLKAGHRPHAIATLMNRRPSTISRELLRNSGQRGYRPRQARRLSQERFPTVTTPGASRPRHGKRHKPGYACSMVPQQVAPKLAVGHERCINVLMKAKVKAATCSAIRVVRNNAENAIPVASDAVDASWSAGRFANVRRQSNPA